MNARWKWRAVAIFYLFFSPLAWITSSTQLHDPLPPCLFLVLQPVGMILGLVMLVPHERVQERRGFEVKTKTRGGGGQGGTGS